MGYHRATVAVNDCVLIVYETFEYIYYMPHLLIKSWNNGPKILAFKNYMSAMIE